MLLEPGKIYPLPPGEQIQVVPDPRIAALEAARMFTPDWDSRRETADVSEIRDIFKRVGLAHLFPGNPDKAEEAVSSTKNVLLPSITLGMAALANIVQFVGF